MLPSLKQDLCSTPAPFKIHCFDSLNLMDSINIAKRALANPLRCLGKFGITLLYTLADFNISALI
jgi:hypothetical protein